MARTPQDEAWAPTRVWLVYLAEKQLETHLALAIVAVAMFSLQEASVGRRGEQQQAYYKHVAL